MSSKFRGLGRQQQLGFNKVMFSLCLFLHLSSICGKWYWFSIGAVKCLPKIYLSKNK